MVLLMCHTHYTLTQPETLGLINVHCILNAIFNGKQTKWASSMLTKIAMHVAVNMVGARRWCGVVLIMGHCHQWRHRLGVSWRRSPYTFILNDDRLLYPALFFKSITLRV